MKFKFLLVENYYKMDIIEKPYIDESNRVLSIVKKTGTTYKIIDSDLYFTNSFHLPEDFTILGETNHKRVLDCLRNEYPELLI